MKKKSLKKKMVIALAGIILAGSMGWSQIPARAAVNGETICSHSTSYKKTIHEDYVSNYSGHMKQVEYEEWCADVCKELIGSGVESGDFEAHNFTIHDMIEDLHNGLYWHWIKCGDCGYEDEVLSGDPNDPQL